MRYTIFGIKDDVLVENHTDLWGKALYWADKHSSFEYKARIWDNVTRRFIAYGKVQIHV